MSLTHIRSTWKGISVDYISSNETGEFTYTLPQHVIGVLLAPHDRVTWRIDAGSSQTAAIAPGNIFLYSKSDFSWLYRSDNSECVHMMLEPGLMDRVAAESGLSGGVELDCRMMFADPTILHLAQLFKAEMLNKGLAGTLYTESLANVLAVHLLRHYSAAVVAPKVLLEGVLDNRALAQVKDFIEEHLAEELTISELAAIVSMSQFHFARAFKAATGQPPHRYVVQRRMERAKILLSVTRLSVAEVTHRVGFVNQSHFTAQFRKATGVTPKQYRDSLQAS